MKYKIEIQTKSDRNLSIITDVNAKDLIRLLTDHSRTVNDETFLMVENSVEIIFAKVSEIEFIHATEHYD